MRVDPDRGIWKIIFQEALRKPMFKPINLFIHIIVQVGGWALLSAAFLVTYDVITRKLLNISIAGADEISGYVFAISTACAYSYALLTRANIRIDFIYNKLSIKIQRILDALSMVLTAGFLAVICYFAFGLVSDAIEYSSKSITPLQTPLAIPQTIWFAALCFALFTAIVLTVMSFTALLKSDYNRVNELIGIPSLDEEIQAELHGGEDPSQSEKHLSGKG
ncbi:TRAP transporter small permease subunit [Sneathiella sp.]|uniref:TRAP transporter small permease subunit n=1 Tax=Sneathiella sp. TaxID=1964365 RepID=UPI0039E2A0DC